MMALRIFVNISVNVPFYVRAPFCNDGDWFSHFSVQGGPEGSLFPKFSVLYSSSWAENLRVVLNRVVFPRNSLFPPVTKNNTLPWKRVYFPTNQFTAYDKKTWLCHWNGPFSYQTFPLPRGPFASLLPWFSANQFPYKSPIKPIQFLIIHTPVLKIETLCYFETLASAYKSRRCHNQ
jgi:hypothetical protein